MRFLIRLAVSAAALIGIAYLSEGALVTLAGEGFVDQLPPALFAAFLLAVVNATIRPVIRLLALPLRILTLGLFGLVINAAMLALVAWIVPGFGLVGWWQTVLVAVMMSIVTAIAAAVVDDD